MAIDANAAFQSLHLRVMMGSSLWLQDQQNTIGVVGKTETKKSLKGFEFIKHALGYGPFGYHCIQRTIEKAAQACIQENTAVIMEHLKALQTEPQPDKFQQDLDVAFITIDQIDKNQSKKDEMLKKVRSVFFQHATILGKCCLLATTALEKIRKIFLVFRRNTSTKSFWIVDRFKHILGFGPLGYHTLNRAMEETAKKCRLELCKHSIELIKKTQTDEPLSVEEIGQVMNVLDRREQIDHVYSDIQQRFRTKFFSEATVLSIGILQTTSVLEYLRKLFRKEPFSLPPVSLFTVYESLFKPYASSSLLWQANKGTDVLQLYFAMSGYSQQIELYKNKKFVGHVLFSQDTLLQNESEIHLLKIHSLSALDPDANHLFFCFLQHLKIPDKRYENGIAPLAIPTEVVSYTETQTIKETMIKLKKFESIVQKVKNGSPFPHLLEMTNIIKAAEALDLV